jgi:hypothetical protein
MIGVVRRHPSMVGTHIGHVSNSSETRLIAIFDDGGGETGIAP